MNSCSIRRKYRCLYRRTTCLEGAPIERNSNDVFEIEINCMGCQRVSESIERLVQRGLEFSDDSYDSVNSRPVQQSARSPDEYTNVFVKLDVSRQYHFVHSIELHSCHSVSLDGLAIE
jgi:hypothetical protein